MSVSANRLGTAFATALAQNDFDTIESLLADDIDFRALTPRKFWEMHTAKEVVADVLQIWFDPDDHVDELVAVQVRPVANGRSHVSYRLRVTNADGPHLVEQQAYFDCGDERITWMRVLCSGYLPV